MGSSISLIPYEQEHVPLYHQWLACPHIQQMTATEPLDLQTEREYQVELAHSTNKFTKLIQVRDGGALIGDINVFFLPEENSAELNIMIAEEEHRMKGFASEALILAMVYSVQKFNVARFFVKILEGNQAARRFFAKHGFVGDDQVDAFGEVKMEMPADAIPRTNLEIHCK